MTPSEKARQMVDTYALATAGADRMERITNAKGIALHVVSEIIDVFNLHQCGAWSDIFFWQQVQIEIMAL